jgi:23S rRNA (adenine2503-C2)-methyltransferase
MTGEGGLSRNLSLAELNGQVFSALTLLKEGEKITNIVLMGMGEPLANYDNVVRFVALLTDGKAFGFSHNKVTLSTAGLVDALKRLGEEGGASGVNIAVSLNATTDEVRSRIMPINRKYPLKELLAALKAYPVGRRRHITIEYVLISDVNDSLEDARRLVRLLKGIPCKINLIPFNTYPGSLFFPPDADRMDEFWRTLKDAGYTVLIRFSKGSEIQAACGQLRGRPTAGAKARAEAENAEKGVDREDA